MNNIPNNIIKIPCNSENIIKFWLNFMNPFFKLCPSELATVNFLIKKRFELLEKINDINIVNNILMSADIRKEIKNTLNYSIPFISTTFKSLRNKQVIINGVLNPKVIPNITKLDKFNLMIIFDFKEEE